MRKSILPMASAVLALVLPSSAEARASYCSPSGDYCKAVVKLDGRWRIGLITAALYAETPRYRLCVRDPQGEETCKRFRLTKGRYGSYSSRVTWSAHFPTDGGKGTYRVRWRHGGTTYGKPLTFKR